MSKIAVTSRAFSKHPQLRKELSELYDAVDFNDTGLVLTGELLVNFLKGHSKAIVSLETIDDAVLTQVPELKIISKYGVGLDSLDFEALDRRGVLLGWQGGVNRRSVSELTLSLIIDCLRHVVRGNVEIRAGKWQPRAGRQLTGRTVGIVGCGHIGKDLVKLLAPFKCKILVHDILSFPDFYQEHGLTAVSLDQLLEESEIVTIHVPYNKSTHHILSAEKLSRMRTDAVLINTARGNLVDEQALKTALRSGKLAAAAMDAFSVEPPQDVELINLPNFIATPHIGGSSDEAILAMGRAAIEGLEKAVAASEYLNV